MFDSTLVAILSYGETGSSGQSRYKLSRMAGRGPRCGPALVTSLGGGHRTAAYGGRGVRLYLLTTPAMGWRSTAEAAPAAGRAPRHRQGQGPNERPRWWRTRRGRSYTLHTAEALAEDQSRRSGGTSEDWGWRGGTGGGPGPMDIEEARRRSQEPTAVRAGARTRIV